MTITALPTPPNRSMSSDAFVTAADAFLGALPTFQAEANALEANVNGKESSATSSAATATTKAAEASASAQSANGAAGAAKWVSGTTYAQGACVWSPATYLSYRRKTAGDGTTDPANDPTNWVQIQKDYNEGINPLAYAQGVALTAAASGSTGITTADDANLDMGTNNFTLHWEGFIPDTTPTADVVIDGKHDGTNGWTVYLLTTGILRIKINTTNYDSTVVIPTTDNRYYKLSWSITRESASVAGSAMPYVNGYALGASVAITAGVPITISNAVSKYLSGTSTTRSALITLRNLLLNRALTSGEVLSLCLNGVDEADKDGNQTILNINTCTSTTNAYTTFTGASATGFTAADAAPANNKNASTADEISIVKGKHYSIEFDATLTSGAAPTVYLMTAQGSGVIRQVESAYQAVAGRNIVILTGSETDTVVLNFGTAMAATSYAISNLSIKKVGTVARYESENIQLDKWYDTSSNGLHASYPASGFSFTRPVIDNNMSGTQTDLTGSATLTIAQLLTKYITDTHATAATATYTLPTATLMDAALPTFEIGKYFDWTFTNLSAAAADTATIAAGASHTTVGNLVIQSSHATTGALYGNSAMFRTKKTAASTYVTSRIS